MSSTVQGRSKCPTVSNFPELQKECSSRLSWWYWPHGVRANVGFAVELIYWPGMTKDTERHIAKCDWCIHFKSRSQNTAMENIQATNLLQLVHLDYLTIKVTEGGEDVHMLIISYHFTWYAQALLSSLQTPKYIAQAMWDWFVVHYGLPEHILWSGSKFQK